MLDLFLRRRSVLVREEGGQYLGRVVVLVMDGGRYLGVGERGESLEKLNERWSKTKKKEKNV